MPKIRNNRSENSAIRRRSVSALLLAACVGVAACQSAGAPAPAAEPLTLKRADGGRIEAAQLLAGDAFWPGADRLLADKNRGLLLLDGNGAELATLPGRFGSIDHRAGPRGLLVAAQDDNSQRPLLVTLTAGSGRWSEPLRLPRPAFKVDGLCLHRDGAGNEFLFLVGEEGLGEQWLVATDEQLLAQPRRVRALSLPPDSEYCQVDDAAGLLYVNEENVGLWAYEAHPEAPLLRHPVAMRRPFGAIAEAAAGLAVVPGGLLALDPAAPALHRYRRTEQGWRAEPPLSLAGLEEPEQLSARVRGGGLELLVNADNGLRRGALDWLPPAPAATPALPVLPVLVQTDPVPSLGDAADDPAIWVHPTDPGRSRVLGTDKQGGLLVYDLAGRQLQDLRVGRLNNVDLRGGFALGGELVDLAVATNRDHNSLHVFAIDRRSGELRVLGEIATPLRDIYGICLFKDAQGSIHAIPNDKDGSFLQYRLSAPGGAIQGELVRRFAVASQPEGCVADDRGQRLFVGEEDVAVWTLDARADAPAELTQVIAVGERVHDDIEGLALWHGERRSYLVVSSQGNDSYVVLDALPHYAVRGAFHAGLNAAKGIDGASETDGLEVTSANLGGPWRQGLLVVQDGRKRMPEGPQNYKYLPWLAVAEALGLD